MTIVYLASFIGGLLLAIRVMLFGVERRFLPRMMFPVGGYRKPEIRSFAQELGLRVADKKDSQEICFVPDGDHAAFIRRRRGVSSIRDIMPRNRA